MPVLHPLPAHYAFPLAELALFALSKADTGEGPSSGRFETSIVSDTLGGPALLLAPTGEEPPTLRAIATSGVRPPESPIPATGALAEALVRESCVELRPMPDALSTAGSSGYAVRIGSGRRALAVLVALAPEDRPFDDGARGFLQSVATTLRARFHLMETRRALEESQARARAILQTTVDGVITINQYGRIDSFNDGAQRIFGYTAEEVVGKNVNVLMPEPYHSEHDGYLEAYRETGLRRIVGIGREVVGRRRSGATFPLDLAVSEVTLPDGERLFTGIIRDLSSRRVLEREVLRVAEVERRRIGQDLHDGLGQELTAIGLFLRGLARTLDAEGSAAADEARRLAGLVESADASARTLARSLVPVELEANGLEAALERLAERATSLYGVTVTTETLGSGAADASALTADAATNLYRITQEAVSNAAQHGEAAHVAVALVRGADQLRLRVEDDGVGIHETLRRGGVLETEGDGAPDRVVSAPTRSGDHLSDGTRGMGLRIMHYRAHLAGGSLEIRPGARGGTVVTCTVPLRGPGFLGDPTPVDSDSP